MGDVIPVRHTFAGLDENHAAGLQRPGHALRNGDALVPYQVHQFAVVTLGIMRVGTDEEAGPVIFDPGRELVQLAIDRVEQEHAAYAIAEAADFQAPGGRYKAAAVADDDDRHVRERFGGARIAIEFGEMVGRFRYEA